MYHIETRAVLGMDSKDLDIKQLVEDPNDFCEALSYTSYPSLSLLDLKEILQHHPSLVSSRGKYGSACFYAADRDGDEEFIRTLLESGDVPLEHLNEAILRCSHNGLLGVLRVFVEYGGINAITYDKSTEKVLANCDFGIPNGPCWRYLK